MDDGSKLSQAGCPDPGRLEVAPAESARGSSPSARGGKGPFTRFKRPSIAYPDRPGVLLGLTLLFALAGQFYFARLPDYLWDGIALYAASGLCLVLLVKALEAKASPDKPAAARPFWRVLTDYANQEPLRAGLYGEAFLSSLWIIHQMRSLPDGGDHYPVMSIWGIAILSLVMAPSLPPHLSDPVRGLAGFRPSRAVLRESTIVALVLLAVYVIYLATVHRALLLSRKSRLLLMSSVALLVALPYLTYCGVHPGTYLSRTNQVGIFQSGWYARELAMGRDAASVLTEQALRSLLAFNYYPDKAYWYHPGIPLLDFFSSILFILGLVYVTWHIRERRYFVLASSYWLGLFFGAFLTENPPSSMRLVILSPIVGVHVAIGMAKVSAWAERILSFSRGTQTAVLMTLVGIAAITSVAFYFGEYSKHQTEGYGGPNTEVATEMAWYLKGLGNGYRVYFFGAPRMYIDFATIPFIDKGIQGVDIKEPLKGPPTFVNRSSRNVFIFLPERLAELDTVKAFLPGGIEEVREEGRNSVNSSSRATGSTGKSRRAYRCQSSRGPSPGVKPFVKVHGLTDAEALGEIDLGSGVLV